MKFPKSGEDVLDYVMYFCMLPGELTQKCSRKWVRVLGALLTIPWLIPAAPLCLPFMLIGALWVLIETA